MLCLRVSQCCAAGLLFSDAMFRFPLVRTTFSEHLVYCQRDERKHLLLSMPTGWDAVHAALLRRDPARRRQRLGSYRCGALCSGGGGGICKHLLDCMPNLLSFSFSQLDSAIRMPAAL